jgi:glycosyltransferase involved in cell wall biosynthesis
MKSNFLSSSINNLPTPSPNKKGFPWTSETPKNSYKSDFRYPKITIITPSYNQGQFLEETIRSVLLQNYPNLEYIVIDGGSTDNSVEIIKKYEKWIDYWVSEPDRGQAHAINKGLEIATGEVFNWLNSDDWYVEGALKKVGEAFDNAKTSAVAFREYAIQDEKIVSIHKGSSVFKTLEETVAHFHIDQPCTFFRLDKLKQIGTLNEDLHYLFDAEMWIRYLLLCGNTVVKRKEVMNYFRLHGNSKTVMQQQYFHKEAHLLLCALLRFSNIDNALKEKVLKQSDFTEENILKIYTSWVLIKSAKMNSAKFDKAICDRISLHFYWQHNYQFCRQFPVRTLKTKAYRRAFLYHYLTIVFTETQFIGLSKIVKMIKKIIKSQP